jgi:hypothetical protein
MHSEEKEERIESIGEKNFTANFHILTEPRL